MVGYWWERRCKLSTIMLEMQNLIMFGIRPATIKVIIFNHQHLVTWILIFVDLLRKALYIVNKKDGKIYISILEQIIMIILAFLRVFPFTKPLRKKKKPVSMWLRCNPSVNVNGGRCELIFMSCFLMVSLVLFLIRVGEQRISGDFFNGNQRHIENGYWNAA